VFSAVYFIRHWSWKTVVIRIEVNDDPAKFVEFVGSLEASLALAGGLIFKQSMLKLGGDNAVGASGCQPGKTPLTDGSGRAEGFLGSR